MLQTDVLWAWQAEGIGPFLLRMVALGAAAGVTSWGVVLVVRAFNPDVARGMGALLVTAIVRGIVVGGIVGVTLYWYMDQARG